MCPWPRIQAALTDEYALNVTYRYDRGEPRASLKKARRCTQHGEPAGDCIDCQQCVHVCPTGVDIRGGPNLGCIQCGLCIDACDAVMAKIGRPARLIAYDTDINIKRRQHGEQPFYRIVRSRTMLYAVVIAHRRRGDDLRAGDARQRRRQRAPRPQSDVRAAVRRSAPQRLHDAHPQQEPRAEDFRAVGRRACRRRHRRDRRRRASPAATR